VSRHALLFAFAILLSSVPAGAASADARFSAMDNTVIRVYFATKPIVWSGLPPQVARDFGRGKSLPPGALKHPLPPDLLARLPARRGFEYARVGSDIVLIDKTTRVVVDLLEGILD
jgi:hypothetical protein